LRAKYGLATGEYLKVLISANRITFTEVVRSISGSADWADIPIDLSAYAGQKVYVRLAYEFTSSYYSDGGVWIDSIKTQEVTNPELEGQPVHYTTLSGLQAGTNTLAAVVTDTNSVKHKLSPAFTLIVPAGAATQYTLTINGGAGGGSYISGSTVIITASNAPVGKVFDRWTGATQCVASVTSSPTTVTMPATNISISATYKAVYYALTVIGGTGSGSCTNGQRVTIAATVPVGMRFTSWNDGDTNTPRTIIMPANSISYTARFADAQKPTVAITLPTATLKVSNAVCTVKGTATDNGVMTGVFCRVNSGAWTLASTTNLTTNVWKTWSIPVTLTAGSNLIQVYSMDTAGNSSATSSVSCTYVVPGNLALTTNGVGTVTRAPTGVAEIGKTYTLTAAAGTGSVFSNWTGAVNNPTNKVTTFVMTSNMTIRANFTDNAKPTVAIKTPTALQKVFGSTSNFTVSGTALDNGVLDNVLVKVSGVNGGAWQGAGTTNGLKNWSTPVTLKVGTNTIFAYSKDRAGNCSLTSSVTCVYTETGTLNIITNGPGKVTVAPIGPLLLGKIYTLTAAANAGGVFSNWTGAVNNPTNKVTTFTMTSNMTIAQTSRITRSRRWGLKPRRQCRRSLAQPVTLQ
jgi:hypothetical protein